MDKEKEEDPILNEEENETIDLESVEEKIEELEMEGTTEELDESSIDNIDFDVLFKNSANKHKLEGTHSLKRDTIFMGKLDETVAETDCCHFTEIETNNYELERGTAYESESRNYEDYYYQKQLSKEIYDLLSTYTNIDFVTNRRKPNRQTFNNYYKLCIENLQHNYTKSEIFVELSYYFTDNIFNMFKLLDKKNATGIILELKDKGYLNNIGNIKFI